MKTIFVILLLFLGIGLCTRTYNKKTRALLLLTIVVMLLYISLT
jgi:hypothetical protein